MINSPEIKWKTFIEDELFWKLWDGKEAMISKDQSIMARRNRLRRGNKAASLNDDSRSRSRSTDHNRNGNCIDMERERKEQVSFI